MRSSASNAASISTFVLTACVKAGRPAVPRRRQTPSDRDMPENDPRLVKIFYEVQSGLPRQGPGNRDSTLRALGLCTNLPSEPAVLDVGCGPGMQTMALAQATGGRIIAADNCDEYLAQLRQRLEAASGSERVEVRQADMTTMSFADESFDLIWSEGAAYVMGVERALAAWRPLLKKGGYLAFSELVWLDLDPPEEVAEFFGREYPAMKGVDANLALIRDAGYEPRGDFTLPEEAWWDDYYAPLEEKLPALRHKYENDEQALGVIAMTEAEIRMRREFGASYGYQIFVAQRE
ncbi:MAG: class I SAM-dependent methyltransferase [Planctomycetota bacterium]|nr:MAG: class I SAM-dependent methyltransferase [Planctomycetota bacterium]REJ95772.1 MAG: class I SAM-dependent methyltransferase [Planctomycetota bacterium]